MLSEFKDGKASPNDFLFAEIVAMVIIFIIANVRYAYVSDLAAELVNRIMSQRVPWSTLFAKDDFFTRYRHYLQVIASSDSEERHLTWSGLVESRLRHLVAKLERIDNLVLAHPYIKGFSKVIKYKTAQEKEDAAHGIINAQAQEATEGAADSTDVQTMWISMYYIGLCIPVREGSSQSIYPLVNVLFCMASQHTHFLIFPPFMVHRGIQGSQEIRFVSTQGGVYGNCEVLGQV